MKRAHRMLAVGIGIGVAAVALSAAALAGPAAAAPSGSPSNSPSPSTSSSPSGSPSTTPSGSPSASPSKPSTAPSTSDSSSAGATRKAAPKATVYDVELVVPTEVTLASKGPGTATNSVNISVHNAGTVAQQGLTVTVVAPTDAHLTGALVGATGIDNCVTGTSYGRDEVTCQVHDGGPGRYEHAGFVLTGQIPLPTNTHDPFGTVNLRGFHTPNANIAGTSAAYLVRGVDTSKPIESMDLVASASPVTMTHGTDGKYHGILRTSFTNRGTNAVPPMTLNVFPPQGVELLGPSGNWNADPCVRVNGRTGYPTGLKCQPGMTLQPGQSFTQDWDLSADKPITNGTTGDVFAEVVSDHLYSDPKGGADVSFTVTFASTSTKTGPSTSPNSSGQAAGSATSLPVTGTPLALIAGGGAAVLVAGGALLVLGRRRAQSPKIWRV